MLEHPTEVLELGRHQQPGAGILDELRDRLGRGMGAMRRAERVVDVDIGQRGKLVGEGRVVLLLLRVEPQVLEQHDAAWPGARSMAAFAGSPTQSSANVTRRPSSSSRRPATGRSEYPALGFPFGRPRCEQRMTPAAPCVERVLDRRQRRADARVVVDLRRS